VDGEVRLAVGGELRLARSEALPIRSDFDADPIRALLGALTGLGRAEHACVQILTRPVAGRRVARARRAARRLHAAQPVRPVGLLLDALTPGPSSRRTPPSGSQDRHVALEHSAQDKVIVTKQRGAQFETRIRYAISTAVPHAQAPAAREVLRGRAHAVASAFAAFSDHNRYRRVHLRRLPDALAGRWLDRGDLLSVPELAAVAHLPTDDTVPGLHRAGARAVAPPPGTPAAGPGIKPIGVSDSGHPRPVGLHVADAAYHLHVLGATGSGKSELLAQLILDDATAGRGVVVIDPKGDLVTDVLMRLPESAGEKVVLFDADSRSRPPVINPLEGEDTARVVDDLVGIFSRVYADSWGARTEDILRASLLTLTSIPGTPTLLDLPKLLTVPQFRARLVEKIEDPVLLGFWQWYASLTPAMQSQVIAPLMNKVRGFLLRPFVRAAIAGGPSTVDMDAVLDGQICLVRIGKDALGTETACLFGSIVVARTWQAATRRARVPKRLRRPCSLYVDECHQFLNLPYPLEDMLAEARAYPLAMTLAHQYWNQLTKDLEEGISANARSKVFFSTSPEDARRLVRHTEPRLSAHDLANLGRFQIAARLVVGGAETPAFTATTCKLPRAIPGRAKAIRAAARANTRPLNTTSTSRPRDRVADPRRSERP
ncbi:helicase HerA domain-containing protein, partial [Kutzneria sp. NPDC052558]|uniref:type IV secretory system conjugative DNA transfer family protein n=1 Tax=Kutzneria sp. NPDC052558 TaxID=3364121 RepID=UPI0037C7E5FE